MSPDLHTLSTTKRTTNTVETFVSHHVNIDHFSVCLEKTENSVSCGSWVSVLCVHFLSKVPFREYELFANVKKILGVWHVCLPKLGEAIREQLMASIQSIIKKICQGYNLHFTWLIFCVERCQDSPSEKMRQAKCSKTMPR